MITLPDLLLKFMLPITGLALGIMLPEAQLGLSGLIAWVVAIPCAILGLLIFAFVGNFLNRLLLRLMIRGFHRKLEALPTPELAAQLPTTFTPNFILLELARRGEDLSKYVGTMLSLLEHPVVTRRQLAWVAFQPAFPGYTALMKGYRPQRPVAECHGQVEIVRKQLQPLDPSS